MPTEGTTHERMALDENEIVETDIEIVGILGTDGEVHMKLRVEGEANFANCIGLLDQAKHSLLVEWHSSDG